MRHRVTLAVSFGAAIVCLAIFASSLAAQQQSATSPRSKTQVVLLGTGNPFPDPDRSGPATAIVVPTCTRIIPSVIPISSLRRG